MMRISAVSTAAGAGTATVFTTPAFACSSGNLIVAASRIGVNFAATQTVTDVAGNTYSSITHADMGTGSDRLKLFQAFNTAGHAENVVTLTLSDTGQYVGFIVVQYSGVQTASSPVDVTAVGNGAAGAGSSVAVTSTFTTTFANELIIGAASHEALDSTYAADTGYTMVATDTLGMMGFMERVVTSIQSNVTASMTKNGSSNSYEIAVASFKELATAPVRGIRRMGMFGVV